MSTWEAYLGLGANLGDRVGALRTACFHLEAMGVAIEARSSLYETDPVAPEHQPMYLNAVLRVRTTRTAAELLDVGLRIERLLGRTREAGRTKAPRTLDIDVLLFGEEVITRPKLVVPHPGLLARALSARRRLWILNGLALVALFLFPVPFDRTHWLYVSLLSLHWSIFFAWLVGWASLGFTGFRGRVLANPVALYIGKISYGFYIFHPFVGAGIETFVPGLATGSGAGTYAAYALKYTATVAVAALSWHTIEAPINSLKNTLRYRSLPSPYHDGSRPEMS